MVQEKISPTLAESLLQSPADDWLDVILEVPVAKMADVSGENRSERIAKRKREFAAQASPVVQTIRNLGGQVTGEAWINGSLSARVTKKIISALTEQSQVSRIDLPHKIEAETI